MTGKHRCESWLQPIAQYYDDERDVRVASGAFTRGGFRGFMQCEICGRSFDVEFGDVEVVPAESPDSTSLPRFRGIATMWRKFAAGVKRPRAEETGPSRSQDGETP